MRKHYLLPWFLISSLIAALLTSCGFQLQGRVALDDRFDRVHLIGLKDNDTFAKALKDHLQSAGTELSDHRSATAVIKLDADEGRRVLSVSSDGEVSEYELYFRVKLEVLAPDEEKVLLQEQTLVLTRDVLFDEVNVLGNQSEQELLAEELKRDMVRQVMYRLRSIRS